MDEEKDKPKVSYDARLQFYEHLKSHLDNIALSSRVLSINDWYNALWCFYPIAAPFMSQEEASNLEKQLIDLEPTINNYNNTPAYKRDNRSLFSNIIIRNLRKINTTFYRSIRHLLLPLKADDGEFSEEDFLGGSDL